MRTVDRIDARTELYSLGRQAEKLLVSLAEAEEKASKCRLEGWVGLAQQFSTEATLIFIELESIGKKQADIIDQLETAGELVYL